MLTGKYADFAEYFGEDLAERFFHADITRAKKRDKIRRLKEKLLRISAEDVGMAYKHILASDVGVGKEEDVKTEDSWKAENIILKIQILEMEI